MLGVIQLGQVGRHVGRSYIWGGKAASWSVNQLGQVCWLLNQLG